MGLGIINEINEKIVFLKSKLEKQDIGSDDDKDSTTDNQWEEQVKNQTTHKGKVIYDATCCPQDIAYPTNLNLLSD